MDSAPTDSLCPLTALADEDLVPLANSCEPQRALDVLILRHRGRLERLVEYLARGQQLTPEDRKDAQQQAVFGLFEAVRFFDPKRVRGVRQHPFRVFLRRVVRMRFVDFARCIRRERKRCTQSLEAAPLLDSQAYQLPALIGYGQSSSRIGQDPAVIAEANEERERLARGVARLDERQRRVWDALLNGATTRMIAEDLGVTPAVAMHWRQEVITILKVAVRYKGD